MNERRADHFRRVRTAASQMMWTEDDIYPWLGEEWPSRLSAAWAALEAELARLARQDVQALEGFDPAHHLLSRRGPQGQPITLTRAADDWHQRLVNGPKLTPQPRPMGYVGLAPGSAVVLTTGWHSSVSYLFEGEFDARVAPGRPAVTFGPQSRELAQVYRDVADQLRAPLRDRPKTPAMPQPTGPDAPAQAREVSEADYERLCALARAAAEAVPSRDEAVGLWERGVSVPVVDVARRVSRILDGSQEPAWVEPTEGVEPSLHCVRDLAFAVPLEEDGRFQREIFDSEEVPRRPDEKESLEDYQYSSWPIKRDRRIVLTPSYALVIAEVLDEHAARIAPGQSVGQMQFDAFPLCMFLRRLESRVDVL
ncbi:hypothetical protein ABZ635_20605 [Nocardiopsis sp. NPDC007018]|uniref:hypothetical protein n=1 Tax=Nocardiopsis sp. NPDC007018 TaxID=3155721 RepID=UPI0033D2B4F5